MKMPPMTTAWKPNAPMSNSTASAIGAAATTHPAQRCHRSRGGTALEEVFAGAYSAIRRKIQSLPSA